MKKRALILALAGIMAASLTGCGSLKDDAVVVKAGDEEITAGVANFYARYTQAQYETYFASYFGGDDMWTKNASDGKTYEESIKETLLDDLKNMALLEKHMKDYDVKLTKADKKAIDDAAEEFDKANSQKKKRQGIWFRRECKTCYDIDGDRAEDAFGNRSGSKCECNR